MGLRKTRRSLVPAALLYQLLAAPGLLGAPRARVPGRPYTRGEDPCSVPVSDAGAEGLHAGPSSGLLWVPGGSHTTSRLVSSAPGEAGIRPGRSPALLPPSQAQTGWPSPGPPPGSLLQKQVLRASGCIPSSLSATSKGQAEGRRTEGFFQTALFRYSSHTIKLTLLKSTVQWVSLYSQRCATIATIEFQDVSSPPKTPRTLQPLFLPSAPTPARQPRIHFLFPRVSTFHLKWAPFVTGFVRSVSCLQVSQVISAASSRLRDSSLRGRTAVCLSIRPSVERRLGCSHSSAVGNSATANIHEQVFMWT